MKYFIFLVLILVGCSKNDEKTVDQQIYTVQQENIQNTLHFSGIIQPIRETTIQSPVEGIIEAAHLHFGQLVEKDELVFTINSSSLQKEYTDTLTEYLKAKDNWNNTKTKFHGVEKLWESGLIAKNNYLSEKSTFINNRMSYTQALKKLTNVLNKVGNNNYKELTDLSYNDFEKVQKALDVQHNIVKLKAPDNGILLYPPRPADDKSPQFALGAEVKSGQAIALVGDLSGIRIEIDVPEVDIDKIHHGMNAIVKSLAFPKQELKGKLIAINSQASLNSGNSLPSFTGVIEITDLTKEQQQWIKIGMSASIELSLDSQDKILVPISAVKQADGKNSVKIHDKKGNIQENTIITGSTFEDKVIVDAGLQPGDQIIL